MCPFLCRHLLRTSLSVISLYSLRDVGSVRVRGVGEAKFGVNKATIRSTALPALIAICFVVQTSITVQRLAVSKPKVSAFRANRCGSKQRREIPLQGGNSAQDLRLGFKLMIFVAGERSSMDPPNRVARGPTVAGYWQAWRAWRITHGA